MRGVTTRSSAEQRNKALEAPTSLHRGRVRVSLGIAVTIITTTTTTTVGYHTPYNCLMIIFHISNASSVLNAQSSSG